jgi:hypothetical protein
MVNMKSNAIYTQLVKHIFLIPAILVFIGGLIGYFSGATNVVNGEITTFGIYELLISFIIGIVMIIFWLLMKDKVVEVRLGGQNITIYEDDEEEQINWFDIEKLNQLILVNPPLYKLKIRGREGYYLFVTQPFSISFGFGTHDMSEMGNFIKKKKSELGI